MTNPQITTDLSKVLEQINNKLDKIDERLNKLEVGQVKLEEKLTALEGKVDGLSKRGLSAKPFRRPPPKSAPLDSVDFINRGVFIALIVAILGGFAKIFGFVGNP